MHSPCVNMLSVWNELNTFAQVPAGIVATVTCDTVALDTTTAPNCIAGHRVQVNTGATKSVTCGTSSGWTATAASSAGSPFYVMYSVPAADIYAGTAGTAVCTISAVAVSVQIVLDRPWGFRKLVLSS